VKESVSRLGIDIVKNVAICVAIRDKFKSNNPVYHKYLDDLIRDSLNHAAHSYTLTKHLTKRLKPDLSFTIGIIHNTGKLVGLGFIDDNGIKLEGEKLDEFLEMTKKLTPRIIKHWGMEDLVFELDSDTYELVSYEGIYRTVAGILHDREIPEEHRSIAMKIFEENRSDIDDLKSVF
jgi:HD-like signal output (HDOD) protein